MIGRGLVLWEVPVGYVRTEDHRIEMIPDRQVQQAVSGIFAKFREMGSARQVFLWHCQERIPLPHVKPGTSGKEIDWRLPVYNHIIHVLKNPSYSGAFVHGRSQTRTVIRDGRARQSSGHAVPVEDWKLVIHDHHVGYISWEEFTRNQKQLRGNVGMKGMLGGAAKSGPALLAGLLRCARCGRKLHVSYSGVGGRVPRYACRGGQINHGKERCISFGGLRVDQAVAAEVLEAVRPLGVEAALEAAALADHADVEKRNALELTLEKASYEAERVRRQYDAVDPANRLVASELETRWNEALRHVVAMQARLREETRSREKFSAAERGGLLDLGADLTALWNHPQAAPPLKKRVLRSVLEEIVIDVRDEEPPRIHLRLHWAGGCHTELLVARNRTGKHQHATDRNVIELVQELAKVCRDRQIAVILNRLGYRTGPGNTWKESRVASLRKYHQISVCVGTEHRSWRTLTEAAKDLGVSTSVIRRLIRDKILPAKQVVKHAPYVIERNDLELPAVRSAIRAIQMGRRGPRTVPGQPELPFK